MILTIHPETQTVLIVIAQPPVQSDHKLIAKVETDKFNVLFFPL